MITTPITAEILRGAIDLERTERGLRPHRLPAWARAQNTDGQLAMAEAQPSGVRLAFRTRAGRIELDALPTKRAYLGAPSRPDGVYDLVVNGRLVAQAGLTGGDTLSIDLATGAAGLQRGSVGTLTFADLPDGDLGGDSGGDLGGEPGGDKVVEIWLPHNETTELVALRTDAPIEALRPSSRPVWLHHGSSISQGSNATSPTAIWPVQAALSSEVELINLGFGGSALLDPFTARTLRDIPADLISVKIGINLVNTDLMRLRAFTPAVHGFLDTVREGHPSTPLLVVSPLYCAIHEDTPGPSMFDPSALITGKLQFRATGDPAERSAGKLTLNVIRDELARIVRQRAVDDPNLHYLDGRDLYGEADFAELPLPDQLHPDTAAHRRIGARFAERVFGTEGLLCCPR